MTPITTWLWETTSYTVEIEAEIIPKSERAVSPVFLVILWSQIAALVERLLSQAEQGQKRGKLYGSDWPAFIPCLVRTEQVLSRFLWCIKVRIYPLKMSAVSVSDLLALCTPYMVQTRLELASEGFCQEREDKSVCNIQLWKNLKPQSIVLNRAERKCTNPSCCTS